VSHFKLFQEVCDLLLGVQHVLGAELPETHFHSQSVCLDQGAPVGLRASFRNQITLAVEGKLNEADQKLEATQCPCVHFFSLVDISVFMQLSFVLFKKPCQVICLA